jgi:hypothetical protein
MLQDFKGSKEGQRMMGGTYEDLLVNFLALGVPNLEHVLVVNGGV